MGFESETPRRSPAGFFMRCYNAAVEYERSNRMSRVGAVGVVAGALLLVDYYLPPSERAGFGAILFFGGLLLWIASFFVIRDRPPQ
jgi:hypothetical protein